MTMPVPIQKGSKKSFIMYSCGVFFCLILFTGTIGVLGRDKEASVDRTEEDNLDATVSVVYGKDLILNTTNDGNNARRTTDPPDTVRSGQGRASEINLQVPTRIPPSLIDIPTPEGENTATNSSILPPQAEVTLPEKELQTDSAAVSKNTKLDSFSIKILRGEENGMTIIDMALKKDMPYLNFTSLKVFSVDYHYEKRFIFYAALGKIFRDEVVSRFSRIDEPKIIVGRGAEGPVRLAVDWVHDRIYWLSVKYQTVERADLDGSNRTLIFDNTNNMRFPNNIAVDPYQKFLFFVSNHSIFRSTLNGGELTRIRESGQNGQGVRCLALDVHNKRLYYTGKVGNYENGKPYLASIDYEGKDMKDYPLVYKWNDIFSIDLFRNSVYFAHFAPGYQDSVWSADLSKSPATPLMLGTNAGGIFSVRVYHPDVQKE